jgi:hypothetical protein
MTRSRSHLPRSAWLGIAVLAVLLVGCGRTRVAQPTALQGVSPLPRQPASLRSTAGHPHLPSDGTAADLTTRPWWSGSYDTHEGDKLLVKAWLGPALPWRESDFDQTTLSTCPAWREREMVAEIVFSVKVLSTLPINVTLGQFAAPQGVNTTDEVPFIITEDASATVFTCSLDSPYASEGSESLGLVRPGEEAKALLWIVLPNVITPRDPRPTVRSIAGRYSIGQPTITVNGSPATGRSGGSAIWLFGRCASCEPGS